MEYVQETIDRQTGDPITISLGQWYTVSELAEQYGLGPRKFRQVLHHMGVLAVENGRMRLPLQWVDRGYGKRLMGNKGPFDVISPLCQGLIREAWSDTLADYEAEKEAEHGDSLAAPREALGAYKKARPILQTEIVIVNGKEKEKVYRWTVCEEVSWLRYHFPFLSHQQIADILEVDRSLVSRFVRQAQAQADRVKVYRQTLWYSPVQTFVSDWNSLEGTRQDAA